MDKTSGTKTDREFEESLQTEGNKKLAFWTLLIFLVDSYCGLRLFLWTRSSTMGKVVVETREKQYSTRREALYKRCL